MTAIQNGEYINSSYSHPIHPAGRNYRIAEPRSADWKSGLHVLRCWSEMMMIEARLRAQGRGQSATAAGCDGNNPQERLHPLFGRLLGHRRSRKWRMDRPGAGL